MMKTERPATNHLGVIMPCDQEAFMVSYFFGTMFHGIRSQAEKCGKKLVPVSLVDYKDDGTGASAFAAIQHEVDGFIVANLAPAQYIELGNMLRTAPWPLVVLYYQSTDHDIDTVVSDNYQNARAMTEFLVRLGHRRIAFGYHKLRIWSEGEALRGDYLRCKGYLDMMQEHGLMPEILTETENELALKAQLQRSLGKPNPPTALFCHDDEQALKCYGFLNDLNKKVPDDLTIVGYDGEPAGEKADPPLTTLQTPLFEMGVRSVERLLEKIKEQATGIITHQKIVLPGSIVERGSHRQLK
jgi:DNA-binding LacI/PurR family transcriptional regulator